ncbi:DinB family protein [Muricoccus radiodurans]|uniref:DinB family protein n=1 Tax=Muricoccus radiodurans TaxID=2231721 RepID=UPI003CF8EE16
MITPDWCRMMAAYNTEMNRRTYGAAARLSDAERKSDRGAFFGSLHGTLSHLVWADTIWMSRFDGGPGPGVGIKESPTMEPDFDALWGLRQALDVRIAAWAEGLSPDWLAKDLTYFSGAVGRELTRRTAVLVTHLFNHQTHHRGQAHALLTAMGQDTGATDLPFILSDV